MGYLLSRERLTGFFSALMAHGDLIAPMKRRRDGVVTFDRVAKDDDLDRLDLSVNPQFSGKKQFMPAYEELFTYDIAAQEVVDHKLRFKPRILFGLRLCDLNAVRIQDSLFIGAQFVDDQYKAARDAVTLIGWYCDTPPSEFCFCGSMDLVNCYDLLIREINPKEQGGIGKASARERDAIYIDVGSPKGQILVAKLLATAEGKGLGLVEHTETVPRIETKKRLETKEIRRLFDHPEWERVTDAKCLSCQRCTTMCPTCMCFDIYDKTSADLEHGTRERTWDSCHSKRFTEVAGGHVFRPSRVARFKHRVYHKIVYYPEAFGSSMCTGCGRCIEHCPTRIDFVELINGIAEGKK